MCAAKLIDSFGECHLSPLATRDLLAPYLSRAT